VYQEEEYHRLQEAEVVAAQKEATEAVFNRIKACVDHKIILKLIFLYLEFRQLVIRYEL
jgi:hypothetical protein